MRRNLQRLMVAIAAMMICLGASATDKLTRSLDHENALTSLEDLQLATFALQTGDVVLYTPKDWDIKVASFETAISNGDNGVFYKLDAVDAHFRMELYNFNQKRRTYWGSNLAYVNSQPAGQTVIFGLSGASPKFGQDGQDLALWDITYEAGNGFAFKCVGRTDGSIYIGHDGTAARAVSDITYWQAYPLAYKASEVEAAATEVLAAIKLSDSKKAIEDAQAAYASKNSFANLTKYGDAVNAAIDAIAAAEAINKTYASFEVAKAVADQYAAGNVKNVSELGSLYREAVKSQKFAGADMTGAIENFDCAAKDGWTFDKPKGGNGPDHGGDFEYWAGNASDRATASFDYWQEITGLPNGTYTVSAEMYNSLNGEGGDYTEFKPTCGVYATVGEKTVSKLVDTNSETRVPYETEAIEVTDGKIRIGVKSFEAPMAARWFTVDNFKLTLVEPAKAPAPAEDAWFKEIDFCFRDKASTVATSRERTFAVWGADPDDDTNGCIVATAGKNSNATNAQFWIRGAEYVEPTYIGETKAQLTEVYDKGGFASGTGFKVTMRVKADGEYSAGSQTHKAFQHKSNDGFGTLNVTKEWQTVSFVCIADDARAGFTDLCFNLAASDADRTFYFDDIQISRGSDWSLAMKLTDKFKPEGKDQNKPATYVADGDYVEVKTLANPVDPWDNQFFIQIADAAPEGKFSMNDQVKLTFQVMAIPENTALETISCDGQFHRSPDGAGYIGNIDGGNVEITKMNDWIDVEKTLVIKNLDATQYCLNLSKDPASITYRFKDIKAEYTRGMDDWYNNNVVVAKDPAVEYEDGKSYEFPAAPYVYDTKGNGYAEVKTMANPTKEWASQIFFTIPENLAGKQVAISMKVKASKAVTAKAQRHQDNTGSTYMDNYPDANIDFTTEWNKVSVIVDTKKENGEAVDIAKCFVLNLAVDAEALTFDFDSLKFEQYFAPVDYGELIEIPLEGTVVMERDFTKETSYTHSPNWASNKDGYTDKLIVGEGLEIVNTADQGMWDSQFFIMEGFNLVGGRDYAVRYTLKYEGDGGDMQINMGDWTNNDQGVETLAAGPIYTQMVRLFPSFKGDATGAHVFFQSGAIKGRMIVEKVEVIDITPKYDEMDWSDNILKNGDLTGDDMSEFILKNNDVENPEMLLAKKDQYGEIGIVTTARPTNEDGSVGGNDHDAQFFVRLPYVLPKGTLFNFEFDLYAEEINTLAIAAHAEPGQWKANISSVKTDPAVDAVHYQEYLTAPEDMRTIAINLAVATDATYGFSNIKVQIVNDDKAAIEEATQTADATTLWAETLALNEACYAGRTADTEGCSEESVKALTDAVAAGKAELANAEATKETLAAAAKAIEDALAALRGGEGEYLPAPDLTDLIEIAQAQDEPAGSGNPLASKEVIQVEGVDVTNYVTKGDICVVFKMLNIDVKNTDYITIKFAQPTPKGLCVSFWNGTKNVELPEGVSEYNYVYDEDAANDIVDDVIPQVAIISLWNPDVKLSVYGVYKHKVPVELAYTDLTPEMFFQWSATDETAEAISTSPCDYNIATSTGQPYGLSTVNEDRFADLSAYSTIELTATEGEPRLLFNRLVAEGTVYAEVPRDKDKYETVVDNGDGSKTYIVDIAAIVAEYGFAHLHAIKGANWQNTTVNSIKLGYVGEAPEIPVPTNINGVEDGESVKDGKYFINGQIVIVKNGVKYNAAGQVIE